MRLPARKANGYSLIEILVVLAIFGILSLVGVSMLGNRRGSAVHSLLDEIEGALNNARAEAGATGKDVALVTWGAWSAADRLGIAYGDATNLTDAQIKNIATGVDAPTSAALGQTVGLGFRYLPSDVIQARARVVLAASGDWGIATSAANGGIDDVDPFKTVFGFTGQVSDATNIFHSGLTTRTIISGSSQRFSSTFCIQIVGTSPDAGPLPGTPMGLIFVQANGATIYKFYNPGTKEGDGLWRKI